MIIIVLPVRRVVKPIERQPRLRPQPLPAAQEPHESLEPLPGDVHVGFADDGSDVVLSLGVDVDAGVAVLAEEILAGLAVDEGDLVGILAEGAGCFEGVGHLVDVEREPLYFLDWFGGERRGEKEEERKRKRGRGKRKRREKTTPLRRLLLLLLRLTLAFFFPTRAPFSITASPCPFPFFMSFFASFSA